MWDTVSVKSIDANGNQIWGFFSVTAHWAEPRQCPALVGKQIRSFSKDAFNEDQVFSVTSQL